MTFTPQLKQKGFTAPVQPTSAPSVGYGYSGTVSSPQYGATATGYNKPVTAPVQAQPTITTKPTRAQIDQRKKTAKTLYTVSWVVFISYTVLMNYFIWFNRTYLYNEMNLLFATVSYLIIIGAWAYLGGLNDYGIAVPLIPSLILYVGLFSYSTGAVILENYYYRSMINGEFESQMLRFLGVSDFFVIKYMGVSILACLAFTLLPGVIGKHGRKKLQSP